MYDCLYLKAYTGNVRPEPRNLRSRVTFLPLHDYCTQFRLSALKVLPDVPQLSPAGSPYVGLKGRKPVPSANLRQIAIPTHLSDGARPRISSTQDLSSEVAFG